MDHAGHETTGSCLCGQIRFRIQAPLAPIQVCHCSQCRKAQGGPVATNIPVAEADFRFEGGEELLTAFTSSPGKSRCFCSRCGSPIFSRRDSLPGVLRVRAGLLDEPVSARPAFHAYVASKCSWWTVDDGLPQFPGPLA
ncbi:GFA family protein [Aquabacterium sp. A7-Y]|uniref:GFA family protein n=1 Tax=Aquabacterium sp. A7-Y TaxID=1349605 RepID=UPI00223CCBF4|nr:GFA family protein [Aquabacterium sp. A7-Y]MCW7541069.1 GFA family protein [Aquabacterium sp. A7-Y]